MSIHALPPILDIAAAGTLHADLTGRIDRREPIALDGAAVTKIGLAGLQVLAAARAAAAGKGVAFALEDASPALRDMVALARLDTLLDSVG